MISISRNSLSVIPPVYPYLSLPPLARTFLHLPSSLSEPLPCTHYLSQSLFLCTDVHSLISHSLSSFQSFILLVAPLLPSHVHFPFHYCLPDLHPTLLSLSLSLSLACVCVQHIHSHRYTYILMPPLFLSPFLHLSVRLFIPPNLLIFLIFSVFAFPCIIFTSPSPHVYVNPFYLSLTPFAIPHLLLPPLPPPLSVPP